MLIHFLMIHDLKAFSNLLFVACMHLLKLAIMSIQYISNYVSDQDCCVAPPCHCRRPPRRRSPGWSPRASPPSRPSPRTPPSGSRTSPTQTRPRDARRLSKSENHSAVILGIIICISSSEGWHPWLTVSAAMVWSPRSSSQIWSTSRRFSVSSLRKQSK